MTIHPTHIDFQASLQSITKTNMVTIATHVLALASLPLTYFGVLGLTQRLGWHNRYAFGALIVFSMASIAVMFAAIADGLIGPALVYRIATAEDPSRQMLMTALLLNFETNQALAKVYVVASSVAYIGWSIALRQARGGAHFLDLFGLATGLGTIAAIMSGHVQMSAHGFGIIVLFQAVWLLLIAKFMFTVGPAKLGNGPVHVTAT